MISLYHLILGATIPFVVEVYTKSGTNTTTMGSDSSKDTTTAAASDDPYLSSSFIGHSLWLMPTDASNDAYQDIVSALAQEYHTFEFLPHITLVAALMGNVDDILGTATRLATAIAPYEFHLDRISHRSAYFQCVYAQLQTTPEVVRANSIARQYFPERRSDPPYMPHLSLVYGDFSTRVKETEMIPKIQQRMHDSSNDNVTSVIRVDAMELWNTNGPVQDWFRVARLPLSGKAGKGDEAREES